MLIIFATTTVLCFLMPRGRVVWAVIDLPVNRSLRIFSRRKVDPAKITLPWAKSR